MFIPRLLSFARRATHTGTRSLLCGARDLVSWPHPQPVFVLGQQKSGTTAIATLLSMRSGASLSSDFLHRRNYRNAIRCARGEYSCKLLVKHYRFEMSRAIIKDPDLTFFYEGIRLAAPNARFVFIVRDPWQNTRSILDRLKLCANENEAQLERALAHASPAWRALIEGQLPLLSGKSYVEILAKRWAKAVDVYLKNQSTMHLVRYEDFVEDKVGVIDSLCERLGFDRVNDVTEHVDRRFQPPGNSKVDVREFFGTENMAIIEEHCGRRRVLLGYL